MTGRILLIAMMLGIAACASSGSDAPAPETMSSSAGADAMATDGSDSGPGGSIDDIDAPNAEQTASVSDYDPNEVICRREKETGSRFVRKVCRTRAEMEQMEAEAQEATRMMRTGAGGDCALNRNC